MVTEFLYIKYDNDGGEFLCIIYIVLMVKNSVYIKILYIKILYINFVFSTYRSVDDIYE